MAYGEKPLGLTRLDIAAFDFSTGAYGIPVTLPHGRKFIVKPILTSSKMKGYMGATAAIASVITGAEITIDSGTLPRAALALMLGMAEVTTGATPDEVKTLSLEMGKNLPYFGAIGVSLDDESGDTHIGVALMKLTEMPEWTQAGGEDVFVYSEMKAEAIKDANGKVIYIPTHETESNPDFTTLFA